MSERKTPLCPMLLQGWYAGAAYEQWLRDAGEQLVTMEQVNAATARACACDGSRCAWWVPMLFERLRWMLIALGENLERRPMRGVCSKCVSAQPWPDPATTEEN